MGMRKTTTLYCDAPDCGMFYHLEGGIIPSCERAVKTGWATFTGTDGSQDYYKVYCPHHKYLGELNSYTRIMAGVALTRMD